jgi:hypothetical protein
MITVVDPSDGEDMYVDNTDIESPPDWRDRQGRSQKMRKRKETMGRVRKQKTTKMNPHPQNITPRTKTTYHQHEEPVAERQTRGEP